MKSFLYIFNFSFKSIIRSRMYIISTIIILVTMVVLMSAPSVLKNFRVGGEKSSNVNGSASETTDPTKISNGISIAIIDSDGAVFGDGTVLSNYLPGYLFLFNMTDEALVRKRIEHGELYGALIVRDRMHIDFLNSPEINIFDSGLSGPITAYLQNDYRTELLNKYGVATEDQPQFFVSPHLNTVQVGVPAYTGLLQAVIFTMMIYFSILLCGNMIAVSVAQEKSTRSMEMLVTTVRPLVLMFGKVFGVGFAGIAQLSCFGLVGMLMYSINKTALDEIEVLMGMFNINSTDILWFALFFLGGFFMYATVYAAIGSVVSRTEDIQSVQAPIMLFIISGFLISVYGPIYGFSNSVFYKVCSYVPFTSPYVMLTRVFMESINVAHIILSLTILYISVFVFGYISAKIYRTGVFLYGAKPSLIKVFKAKI